MKLLVLLAFATVAVATPYDQITTIKDLFQGKYNERIISGSPAVNGQFPWQVAVHAQTNQGSMFCGGSIISDRWVLTAAHCADRAYSFKLQFGGLTLDANEIGRLEVQASYSIIHQEYHNIYLNNDIALIMLPEPIQFTDRFYPIRLPRRGEQVGAGQQVTVSGWGKTSDQSNSVSNILNFVKLTTISNGECYDVYGPWTVLDSTVCCRGAPEHSSCNGDSGGALVTIDSNGEATQVGIVSFIHINGCASGNPSGYVRTESYLDWISVYTGIAI